MLEQINLLNIPNQNFTFDGLENTFEITLRTTILNDLIMDLKVGDKYSFYSKMCVDRQDLLLTTLNKEKLYFVDTKGQTNPNYKEFNDRYILIYES
ncbi:MAG: hypothetical protein LBF97_00340 [Elusimicrobiota bacterium]|jgi:hypothetical protein|nr:hypothetical protein [Elusimicrobiota bacterium]